MAFATNREWESRGGGTETIDRLESAPTAVVRGCFGQRLTKRWVDGDLNDVVATPNGKRFRLDAKTLLTWEHKQPEGHLYEFGGLKETILLEAAPPVARWRFRLECPGDLQWAFQPELTAEQIANGDTRPDEVVGSYAVFDAFGRKVGHLLRPLAVDADGKLAWLTLQVNAQPPWGVWVTIIGDPAWFAAAKYPVTIDPTFGYTGIGGSVTTAGASIIHAMNGIRAPAADGTTDSISVYATLEGGGSPAGTLGLYNDSSSYPGSRVVDTAEYTVTGAAWYTSNTDSAASILAASLYWFGVHSNANASPNRQRLYYDAQANWEFRYKGATAYVSGAIPDPFPASATTGSDLRWSLYCTYTEAAAGNPWHYYAQL